MVEKYWEAGPGSVCMSCAEVGHNRLGECGDRGLRCIICMGDHRAENYVCGVTGCSVRKGKICGHVTPKCANCGGNHQATAFKYPAWLKARSETWKESKKSQPKDKQAPGPDIPNPSLEMETDNGKEKSTQEPEENLDLIMENDN